MIKTIKKYTAVLLSVLMVCSAFTVIPVTVSAAESGTTGDCLWELNGTELTISGNGAMSDYSYFAYNEDAKAPWKTGITKLTITNGVTRIGKDAFSHCSSLTSVIIPDTVIDIGYSAFRDCSNLKSIKLSESLTNIDGEAFEYCTALTDIIIPTSVTHIGVNAFYGCTDLSQIEIPDSVLSMGFAPFDNTAWYDNQPDGLIYAGKIAYGIKGYCPSNVVIKEGTVSINPSAFKGCTSLTSVKIPNSVTSIGGNAFFDCTNLLSITIPEEVTVIGKRAYGYYMYRGSKIVAGNYTIYGSMYSEAWRYARNNGFTFIALEEESTEPSTAESNSVEPTTIYPTTEAVTEHTTTEPATAPAPEIMIGDVNGDSVVNGADAGILNRYTSGWKGYESKIKSMTAADINGDGNINGADAGILARYTSGWKQYDKFFES